MNRRDTIHMNNEEIQAFLAEQKIVQVATIDHDGWPHLVAMWYVLMDGQIVFWTYEKSQKAVNLRRDAKVTCLVEAGVEYGELQGVQIKGEATLINEREIVGQVGEAIWKRYMGETLNETTRQMVVAQAAKRIVVSVRAVEVVTWDHRKLGGRY